MFPHSQKSIWAGLVLLLGMSGNALANPLSRVSSASKTVVSKVYDGAKGLVTESGKVVKDVGSSAWNVTDSVANHIRSAF